MSTEGMAEVEFNVDDDEDPPGLHVSFVAQTQKFGRGDQQKSPVRYSQKKIVDEHNGKPMKPIVVVSDLSGPMGKFKQEVKDEVCS